MNLLEIILTLHGHGYEKRKQLLKEWDVEPPQSRHIQHLFTDDGKFTPKAKQAFIEFIDSRLEIQLNSQL